jgi:hypothetical protein
MHHLVKGSQSFGKTTAAGGTAFTKLITPRPKLVPKISFLRYLTPAVQHTITIMSPYARTTVTTAAVATGTSLILAADVATATLAGVFAQNDYVAIEHTDGTIEVQKLGATPWDGTTKTLTVSSLAAAVGVGKKVWFFGAVGDAQHVILYPGPIPASGTALIEYKDYVGGIGPYVAPGDPLLIHSDNATTAGFLELADAVYCKEGT